MPKNEVDEFLGSLNEENNEFKDNQDPFEIQETVETEEEKTEEEKALPFHKDPKVLRFIEKEISKRTPKVEETFRQEVKKDDDDDYYVRLIGNDTPEKIAMIREAKARDERMLQMAADRARSEMSKSQQDALEAERQKEEKLANALDDIEDTYNVDITSKDPVAKKIRVDFMNFVEKIAPKGTDGKIIYPDMNSAFETFQELRKTAPNTNRAKDLASRSVSRSGGTIEKPQERITFDNIDGIFEKMFKK